MPLLLAPKLTGSWPAELRRAGPGHLLTFVVSARTRVRDSGLRGIANPSTLTTTHILFEAASSTTYIVDDSPPLYRASPTFHLH